MLMLCFVICCWWTSRSDSISVSGVDAMMTKQDDDFDDFELPDLSVHH